MALSGSKVRLSWGDARLLASVYFGRLIFDYYRGACLHAWKLFSKFLLAEDEEKTLGLYRFRQHICKPGYDLKAYTQPLTSFPIDFITHLVISGGCSFATSDLLCLTDIKNLGVLEIIQPADEMKSTFPQVTDRLIRGWTETEDAFPLLRILRIWGDQSTTQESLRWVSKFPSLALYDVMGSRDDWTAPHDHAIKHRWELADTVSGTEGSLLHYLMLFAPPDESPANSSRDLARSIDSDLLSLCGDSRCAVKFVENRQAPKLIDYLTDAAKVSGYSWNTDSAQALGARACHGIPFEAWAFWLYSFIGQNTQDGDLSTYGAYDDTQAVAGPFVLPSKPMACLYLGHSGRGGITSRPAYVSRGLFATKRFTFIRPNAVNGVAQTEAASTPEESTKAGNPQHNGSGTAPSLRRQKRKRLDHVLTTLAG